ncbi:hypothetical protein CF327_g1766 [Tilletia walkeri]|nr:hypothetical protein CF327_g1766 [Tilletia walkeri]
MSASTPEELLSIAEKKAAATSGWFSSASTKLEEAVELFKAAGNKFRLANRFQEAGDAIMRAAETEYKLGEQDFAANTFYEASKNYKLVRPELAVTALQRATQILVDKGRFRQAADREKAIAELYKADAQDPEKALESYERAGQWYMQENATATASGCFREAATLAAELGQYPKAIERWEEIAKQSLDSALTRYSVKDFYLNAGLCYLAIPDYTAASRALAYYAQTDPTFPPTAEGNFLHSILEAAEHGDLPAFDTRVQEYDRVRRLAGWQATLLKNVRAAMAAGPDLS